jgi:hypothetical protein
LEFDPVDYRFLRTYSNGINVQVITNGVPSVCTGNCFYSFVDYIKITSLSYTNNTLSLSLSNSTSSVSIPTSSISVTVGGLPCAVDNFTTYSALTCTLASNADSSPILVAGDVTPLVYVQPYGIVGLDTGGARLLN